MSSGGRMLLTAEIFVRAANVEDIAGQALAALAEHRLPGIQSDDIRAVEVYPPMHLILVSGTPDAVRAVARFVEAAEAEAGSVAARTWGAFDEDVSIEELAVRQGVGPVEDVEALRGDFWPEDESIDGFVRTVRSWRSGDEADRLGQRGAAGHRRHVLPSEE